MTRLRLLLLISTLCGALLAVSVPAAVASGAPVLGSFSVSKLMPTEATIEGTINPEGSETSYEIKLKWATGILSKKGLPEYDHHEMVIASATLPATTEPEPVEVLLPFLEENVQYAYSVKAHNESGTAETVAQPLETPGGPGTGKPWIESLTASEVSSKGATIEATYNLEAESGAYSMWSENSNKLKKVAKGKLAGQSGTESVVGKLKGKHGREYTLYFYVQGYVGEPGTSERETVRRAKSSVSLLE